MHPRIYQEFERICAERGTGGVVLEIGALPTDKSLLFMKSLTNATERIGINLNGPHEYKGIKIVKGNANSMKCFEDNRFDTVLCNATLEHDKFFWRTISEINRVTKPGGLIVIGVPGYIRFRRLEKARAILNKLKRAPVIGNLVSNHRLDSLFTATITFQVHNAPGDFYRFSQQTLRTVFFRGVKDIDIRSIMLPPRLVGSATKR